MQETLAAQPIENIDALFWQIADPPHDELPITRHGSVESGPYDLVRNEDEHIVLGVIRPPESEIYGRSLRSIRSVGLVACKETVDIAITSGEADQVKAEFYTSVEEGFGTDAELGNDLEVRDFQKVPVIDGRVMARDRKTPVSDMTQAGLDCAKETVKHDERFRPQLVRSERDHENALTTDDMSQRKTSYNTRIVVSPFPEEAARRSGDDFWRDIGYVPHLRRGFVQLYHQTENGEEMLTGSLSFSGSAKRHIRTVLERFDVDIPEDETTDNYLKYAFTGTMNEQEARTLAIEIADRLGVASVENNTVRNLRKKTNTVEITQSYRPLIERVFNESYVHICESAVRGYQTPALRELIYQLADQAGHFNTDYAKALYRMRAVAGKFTDADTAVMHELLIYSTIEMMRDLHLKRTSGAADIDEIGTYDTATMQMQQMDVVQFQNRLSGYGAEGARQNRTYSACGLSISLGGDNARNTGPQSAYGGVDMNAAGDSDRMGSRWFTCSKGHLNYRRVANRKESNCRQCGEDISCEEKPAPKAKPKSRRTSPSLWTGGRIIKSSEKQRVNQRSKPKLRALGASVL